MNGVSRSPIRKGKALLHLKAVLCIVFAILVSCSTSGKLGSSAALTPPRTLTLWEVSREGSPTSYLFGTCHVGVTLDQALPKNGQALIAQSAVVVGEIDPRVIPSPGDLLLHGGQSLSGLVGAEQWAAIVKANDLGRSAEMLNHMHPIHLETFLQVRIAQGLNPRAMIMDDAALRIAEKAKVRREFLETPKEQLGIVNEMPIHYWVPILEQLSDPLYVETLPKQLDDAVQVCRTGDLSLVEKLLEELRKTYPRFAELFEREMLRDRNRRWMPRLDALFQKEPTFVAVGAGHMVGEDGLLKLLEERGYTVTQFHGRTEVAPRLVPPETQGNGSPGP